MSIEHFESFYARPTWYSALVSPLALAMAAIFLSNSINGGDTEWMSLFIWNG